MDSTVNSKSFLYLFLFNLVLEKDAKLTVLEIYQKNRQSMDSDNESIFDAVPSICLNPAVERLPRVVNGTYSLARLPAVLSIMPIVVVVFSIVAETMK